MKISWLTYVRHTYESINLFKQSTESLTNTPTPFSLQSPSAQLTIFQQPNLTNELPMLSPYKSYRDQQLDPNHHPVASPVSSTTIFPMSIISTTTSPMQNLSPIFKTPSTTTTSQNRFINVE